jgi:ankyrin repeat protein
MTENPETIAYALKLQPDAINAKDRHGDTPLQFLFRVEKFGRTNREIMDMLIRNGADITIHGGGGETPLHNAIRIHALEAVKYLIDQGANINAQDDSGFAPLHRAVAGFAPSLETIEYLLEHGADLVVVHVSPDPEVEGKLLVLWKAPNHAPRPAATKRR